MLPEAGATELIFLAAVALIVVGPKDLPVLMRKVGQWVAKMRGLAAEFRSSFDELARQSELDELRKEVEALRNTRIPDPLADLHPTFDDIGSSLDPSGFPIAENHYATDFAQMTDPHAQTATIEEVPAAKPARAPRKPKAAPKAVEAVAEAEPAAAPKPRAAAKPRARRTPTAVASRG
jgi:sec-independent protein translocase protein TatB